MRPFEILFAASLVFPLLLKKQKRRIAIAVSLLVGGVQVVVEGYRWQLFPLFALLVMLLFLEPVRSLKPQRHPPVWLPWITGMFGLLILVLGCALAIALPIPVSPTPSGEAIVGTQTFYLRDDTRTDPYAPGAGSPRELIVQVWYPGIPTENADQAPWMEGADLVAPAIAAWIGMPDFFLDHLVYARSDSYPNLEVLPIQGGYPLILFAHGYGGFRTQNTFQMQELASQGYVVIALEFPYSSVRTIFPDGRVAEHNPDTLPWDIDEAAYQTAARTLLEQWTHDILFVLDQLESWGNGSGGLLSGAMDLSRIGFLGHSTGGAAVLQVCARDARCRVVLGMDSWMYPLSSSTFQSGVSQPWLALFSEVWSTEENDELHHNLLMRSNPEASTIVITGTSHYDFSDLPALGPLTSVLGLRGKLDGERTLELIRRLTLTHFDTHLKGGSAETLDQIIAQSPELKSIAR